MGKDILSIVTLISPVLSTLLLAVVALAWSRLTKAEKDIVELQKNKSSRDHIDTEIGHIKEIIKLQFESIQEKFDFIISTLNQKGKK